MPPKKHLKNIQIFIFSREGGEQRAILSEKLIEFLWTI